MSNDSSKITFVTAAAWHNKYHTKMDSEGNHTYDQEMKNKCQAVPTYAEAKQRLKTTINAMDHTYPPELTKKNCDIYKAFKKLYQNDVVWVPNTKNFKIFDILVPYPYDSSTVESENDSTINTKIKNMLDKLVTQDK